MTTCLFCKITKGEIPCEKLYEDENILAFKDISPKAPVHFLLIPKKHIDHVMDTTQEDEQLLGSLLFRGQLLAKELGLEEGGARFVMNCKADGGQSVDHVHLHVLGGRALQWPPG